MSDKKQQAIEAYFRKMGWRQIALRDYGDGRKVLEGHQPHQKDYEVFSAVPDIIDHFPSLIRYVLEDMGKKGFVLTIINYGTGESWARWSHFDLDKHVEEKIQDNEITLAAVQGATRVLKGKNA